jgi:hypothetical protein
MSEQAKKSAGVDRCCVLKVSVETAAMGPKESEVVSCVMLPLGFISDEEAKRILRDYTEER